MIKSFKHKGLEELFLKSKTKKLPPERLEKIKMLLAMLHAAHDLKDLKLRALRLHQLKRPPLTGFWSIDVSGNFRITFRFESHDVSEVDFQDTH